MKFIFVLVFFIIIQAHAYAGWMVEPYLGYSSGELKQGSNTGITVSGSEYGLRLGYQFLIPWMAVDYTASNQKLQSSPIGYDAAKSALGLAAGLDFPLMRIYAGYGFDSRLYISDSAKSIYKGTYTKFGLGLKVLIVLNLSFEYCMNNYNKLSTTGSADQALSSTQNNSTGVFLSFIF